MASIRAGRGGTLHLISKAPSLIIPPSTHSTPPLDAEDNRPYMPRKMIRLLLTFLALVSGFVAEGSPAQARVFACARAEVGAVQVASGAETLAVARAQVGGFALRVQPVSPRAMTRQPALTAQVSRITAVRVGIDRALA